MRSILRSDVAPAVQGSLSPLTANVPSCRLPIPNGPHLPGGAKPVPREVHVHLLAQCDEQASRVIDDLRAEYGLPVN